MSATYDFARWGTLLDVESVAPRPGSPQAAQSGSQTQLLPHIKQRAIAALIEDDRQVAAGTRYATGVDGLASLVFIRPVPPDTGPDVLFLDARTPFAAQIVVDALNAVPPPAR